MATDKPHKAAFLSIIREDPSSVHYLMGYLSGVIEDDHLCAAIQAWRTHQAALADLEQEQKGRATAPVYDPRD